MFLFIIIIFFFLFIIIIIFKIFKFLKNLNLFVIVEVTTTIAVLSATIAIVVICGLGYFLYSPTVPVVPIYVSRDLVTLTPEQFHFIMAIKRIVFFNFGLIQHFSLTPLEISALNAACNNPTPFSNAFCFYFFAQYNNPLSSHVFNAVYTVFYLSISPILKLHLNGDYSGLYNCLANLPNVSSLKLRFVTDFVTKVFNIDQELLINPTRHFAEEIIENNTINGNIPNNPNTGNIPNNPNTGDIPNNPGGNNKIIGLIIVTSVVVVCLFLGFPPF